MRTARYFLLAALALGLVGLGVFQAREKDKPKYTIKQVMKMAHTAPEGESSLLKTVSSGKGEKADKEKLVELYTALCQNKPPKGDADEWKERCTAMVKAAKAAVSGGEDEAKALGKAVNCKGCHELHKGK
jgi:hypothetical protein